MVALTLGFVACHPASQVSERPSHRGPNPPARRHSTAAAISGRDLPQAGPGPGRVHCGHHIGAPPKIRPLGRSAPRRALGRPVPPASIEEVERDLLKTTESTLRAEAGEAGLLRAAGRGAHLLIALDLLAS